MNYSPQRHRGEKKFDGVPYNNNFVQLQYIRTYKGSDIPPYWTFDERDYLMNITTFIDEFDFNESILIIESLIEEVYIGQDKKINLLSSHPINPHGFLTLSASPRGFEPLLPG